MECLRRKGESGFSSRSTAEEVTDGIDGTALTAIVTGATSGIGEETERVLALRGVHVVMAVRNTTAGEQVKQKTLAGIPAAKVDVMELDLSSMASVRKFASEYKSSNLPLNILINNAGACGIPLSLSKDGIELQFATNYIGASRGIGGETARVLALRGVHVVVAVRNTTAGEEVKKRIVEEIPGAKVDVMEIDLSSMASVRKFASEYYSSNLPLNILINNAGVLTLPFRLSKDEIELHFATNYLGHFLLTHLLLDIMKETTKKTGTEGRIINLTSSFHVFTYDDKIRFDRLNDQSGYKGLSAYAQSKLANILHANELARRLKDDGANITANCVHPGLVATHILGYDNFTYRVAFALGRCFLKSVRQGASTTCYVALHPQVKGVSGEYFRGNNMAERPQMAEDVELARKLWDFSMDLINAET